MLLHLSTPSVIIGAVWIPEEKPAGRKENEAERKLNLPALPAVSRLGPPWKIEPAKEKKVAKEKKREIVTTFTTFTEWGLLFITLLCVPFGHCAHFIRLLCDIY